MLFTDTFVKSNQFRARYDDFLAQLKSTKTELTDKIEEEGTKVRRLNKKFTDEEIEKLAKIIEKQGDYIFKTYDRHRGNESKSRERVERFRKITRNRQGRPRRRTKNTTRRWDERIKPSRTQSKITRTLKKKSKIKNADVSSIDELYSKKEVVDLDASLLETEKKYAPTRQWNDGGLYRH